MIQAWLYYFQHMAESDSGSWIDSAIAIESTVFSSLVMLRTMFVYTAVFTVCKVTPMSMLRFCIFIAVAAFLQYIPCPS